MKPVSSAAQCRALDERLIAAGIPGVALMDVAARSLASAVVEHFPEQARRRVVIACGPGNNGGDGFACARWLKAWGFPVSLWILSKASRGDAAVFREACERLAIPQVDGLERAGVVVDAIFGTGLDRELSGRVSEVVAAINAFSGPVVAADLPTGLNADTGRAMGNVVHAQVTVTFGRWKPGLLMGGGPHHSGKVVVADLGQGAVAKEADETASLLEGVDIAGEWPNRLSGDHKNRSGHLLLIAGSESMAGAAVLAARGALAAGVGLLTLSTPRSALPRLAGLPSEAMWIALEELDASVWREKTAWAIGPGLSALSEAQRALLLERWVEAEIPAVGDAAWLDERLPKARLPRVITPHPGEAARILNVSKEEIQADRLAAATALAAHGVALLKGPFTVVASPDGKRTFNSTNSQVLGTGGSGDVLTGVIGALLARGVSPDRAARMAAWVHGRAGELLEAERSQGWTASDIAERIPAAIEDLVRTSSKFP